MDSKEIYDYIIRIQAIAKIGLVYSKDPYALSNYEEINKLSLDFLEKFLEVSFSRPSYFQRDIYPTPNISCRTIIFNKERTKILMVRESDSQTYSLPGGWCELYDSPATAAKNECSQEAGADVDIIRLVGVLNRTPFKSNISIPEYVIVFEGVINGPLHEHEYETDDVAFFDIASLPEISRKLSKVEFLKIIDAAKEGKTIFD